MVRASRQQEGAIIAMMETKATKRILVVGAHPDDCDFETYGITTKLVRKGNVVKYISVTNGNAGHYAQKGKELADRRYEETQASAKALGITYDVLDHDDGRLTAALEVREELIRKIREFCPDVIITNRPNDYHVDHRNTALLIQDASYLLAVPNICPDTPALKACPVILFWADHFQDPKPFRPDIALITDEYDAVLEEVVKCHESQSFEWLPWIEGNREFIRWPFEKRRDYVLGHVRNDPSSISGEVRRELARLYGEEAAAKARRAEAFQASEYGAPLTPELLDLFEN